MVRLGILNELQMDVKIIKFLAKFDVNVYSAAKFGVKYFHVSLITKCKAEPIIVPTSYVPTFDTNNATW